MDSAGMAFYTKMVGVANRLIGSKGQSMTFSRYSPTSNPTTGDVTKGAATATFTAQGLVEAASGNQREPNALADSRQRSLFVSAATATFEPMALDEVEFDGSTWLVESCAPLNPGGIALAYTVTVVRK